MKLLYAGLAIALLISVLAPYLASSDPDGLESAAESVIDEERFAELEEADPAIDSPMPDYSIEGKGKLGEIVAISAGTIGILVISFGLAKVLKSNRSN
ncbi:cobalamin biosynthesis protein CbiN [Methanococcoides methylutens]|uniref:Cobalamin biosynthesis protein CbiN n=1 Tax=Methanococcoides methylutens TaxID=2226 RepID=A0A099T1Z7_METMT|nr:PDGLE domain-containing protein [Methanococcoides methylutens]KGK98949.1 cobalamin biosynthesis protein CbiN [Methanococcoides methylutens]